MSWNRTQAIKAGLACTLLPALQRTARGEETEHSFNYTYEDIQENLVIIEAAANGRTHSHCGFIMMMQGKPYLITNQHTILGTDRLKFVSPAGRVIKPRSIELSAASDIARLGLGAGPGLTAGENPAMGDPVAVFGHNGESAAAHEIHGRINGVGADLIEVSAAFETENNGAPVLNADQQVLAIASYVRKSSGHIMKQGTRFENRTRRFCHRLHGVHWQPVNWKKFNAAFGKAYQESSMLLEDVIQILNSWADGPLDTVRFSGRTDKALAGWLETHNKIVSRAVDIGDGRREFYAAYSESASQLAARCETQAREMFLLAEKRGLTEFLVNEFEEYGTALQMVADVINRYGSSTY